MAERLCSIEGCGKKHRAKGWCKKHYQAAAYSNLREKKNARRRARYAAGPERERARVAAWRVANPEKKRAWDAAWYASLSGVEHNKRLLRNRRLRALARMKKRHQTKERVDG